MAVKLRSHGDDGWKIILQSFLPEFLDFFFPQVSRDIKRDHYEFLDGELQSLSRRVGTGKRITDRLVKSLDEKGFSRHARRDLYLFIDWLLALPEPLDIEFVEEMKVYEEGMHMAYISSAERIGIKKGIEKGLQKGKLETAVNMVNAGYDRETVKKLTGLTDEQLAGIDEKKP
ncbi:MAG: hypothetical protein RDV48_08205 [Candidatus Eremiobacteraeota bacterium]|nr:hypothetical protein [Candidatus Eremiobacteraeota bacterium]